MKTVRDSFLLGVAALLLYLPNLSQHFDLDGVAEARALEDRFLFTPNHLLYRPIGYAIYQFLDFIGYHVLSLSILRVLSAVFGAAAIALSFVALQRLTKRRDLAFIGSIWLATTPAYWYSSTDSGYITLAAMFMAAALVCLVGERTKVGLALCGVWVALAVLAWQCNVFFLPVVAISVWWLERPLPFKTLAAKTLAVLLPCMLVIGGGYAACGIATYHTTLVGLIGWVSGHVGGALPQWGNFEAGRIAIVENSIVRSVLSDGHIDAVSPAPLSPVPAQIALILLLAWAAVEIGVRWKRAISSRRTVLLLTAAFVVYLPFLTWWDPAATKWYVDLNVFLVGAVLIILSSEPAARVVLVVLIMVTTLNATTVFADEVHLRHANHNAQLATAGCVAAHMTNKDLFLATDWDWAEYVPYFYHRRMDSILGIAADLKDKDKILQGIHNKIVETQRGGGQVYMVDLASYGDYGIHWLSDQTGITRQEFEAIDSIPAFNCEVAGIRRMLPLTTSVPHAGVEALPIAEVEKGPLHNGYVVITPDKQTAEMKAFISYGKLDNALVLSEVRVASTPLATDASLALNLPDGRHDVAIAIANPGSARNAITITLRDANGVTVGAAKTLSLEPGRQFTGVMNEMSPSLKAGIFQGSLGLQGTMPISILGFQFIGDSFEPCPLTEHSRVEAAAGTIVFPQFAEGAGWATQLTLVNNGEEKIGGRADIFDVSGKPLAVRLNGVTQSSFKYSISARQTFVLAPRDAVGQSPLH